LVFGYTTGAKTNFKCRLAHNWYTRHEPLLAYHRLSSEGW